MRLFAMYREIAGRSEMTLSVAENGTLEDLLHGLLKRFPRLAGHRETMLLAVNHEFADPSDPLREGDEVAIMPPVSGGGL